VTVVVDDALLLGILAGADPYGLSVAGEGGEIYTTGSWYWRLARAVTDGTGRGTLSRAMLALPPERQSRVLAAVEDLPTQIGVISLRRLVPVMAALDRDRSLNLSYRRSGGRGAGARGRRCRPHQL
jgi:hypothetical protein